MLTSNNTFGLEDLSAQFNSKMDSLSDVFVEKAKLNQTNEVKLLGEKEKSKLVNSLVSKTLKQADNKDSTEEQTSHKAKSVKDMKKEQKKIKKQVKQIREMLSKKDE